MKIKKVKILNFMSFDKAELDLDILGLSLILGKNEDSKQFDSNGSGKSCLFDSIVWCLYGEILRNVPVDSLVRNGEKIMEVSVVVDPEDGSSPLSITRKRAFGRRSELVVKDIVFNKEVFPSTNIIDLQHKLNDWYGLDFKTFTNSVYFGKGLSQFFMVADDKTRKDILESILQLSDFDTALSTVKDRHKNLENENIRVLQERDYYTRKEKDTKEKLNKFIQDYNDYKLSSSQEIEKFENMLVELENKKHTFDKDLSEITSNIENATNEFNSIKNNMKLVLDAELIKIQQKFKRSEIVLKDSFDTSKKQLLDNFNSKNAVFIDKISVLETAQENIKNVREALIKKEAGKLKEIQLLESNIKKLDNLDLTVPCPTCFSSLTEEHNHSLRSIFLQNREELQAQLKAILSDKKDLEVKDKELNAKIIEVKGQQSDLQKEYNASNVEMLTEYQTSLSSLLSLKQKQIEEAKEKSDEAFLTERESFYNIIQELAKKKNILETEVKSIDSNISLINTSLGSILETLKNKQEQIDFFEKDLVTCINKIEDFSKKSIKTEKELKMTAFWVEAFSQKGIRSFIFENALPQLTERANYYSSILTGGSIVIEILPTTTVKTTGAEKEKLNIIVTNSLGASDYAGCSEGEKRRVDLCILLALQDLIASRGMKNWSTLIYDELFDTLDNTGISNIIDLFKTVASDKNIFIISHNSDLKSLFDSGIVVKKQGGVSYVS